MPPRLVRYPAYGLVLLQALLIMAYALPAPMVPEPIRTISVPWIRPLFHQQWNLFAPDPLLCAPEVQVRLPDGSWRSIIPKDGAVMHRRMARPLAAMVQEQVIHGDPSLHPVLAAALHGSTQDMGREWSERRFRLVEECVLDAAHPEHREQRITELVVPER